MITGGDRHPLLSQTQAPNPNLRGARGVLRSFHEDRNSPDGRSGRKAQSRSSRVFFVDTTLPCRSWALGQQLSHLGAILSQRGAIHGQAKTQADQRRGASEARHGDPRLLPRARWGSAGDRHLPPRPRGRR